MSFPGGSDGKESTCNVGNPGSIPGQGKIPGRRKRQPTPVSCLEKSYGWRSLVGYSPWGHKEVDMTEWLTLWGAFVSFTCLLNLSCTLFFFVCLGKCQHLTNNPTLASLSSGLLRLFDSSSEPGLHWNHGGSVNILTPGSLPKDSDFIDLDRHWSAAWEWRFLKASQRFFFFLNLFIWQHWVLVAICGI